MGPASTPAPTAYSAEATRPTTAMAGNCSFVSKLETLPTSRESIHEPSKNIAAAAAAAAAVAAASAAHRADLFPVSALDVWTPGSPIQQARARLVLDQG